MSAEHSWLSHGALILSLLLLIHRSSHVCSVEALSASVTTKHQRQQNDIGIYVHIPYCRRRCRYCDFAIVPIGSSDNENSNDRRSQGFVQIDRIYRKSILDELNLLQRHSKATTVNVQSIYFGGGTPSLAPLETIAAILKRIQLAPCFLLDTLTEITMEMDPGTFSLEKLKALKELGVNRISLGVQSFDDGILEQIGRVHRSNDIFQSLKMIQQVFGESPNYSIDLISGLPGVSLAKWVETLEQATQLCPKPTHLSLYDLQVEAGTVFDKWYSDEQQQASSSLPAKFLPTPDDCAFMYKYSSGYLKAFGYHHYEISSYSLAGYRSRHNQIYWQPRATWYAVGLGATSSVNGTRYTRPRAMQDYVDWVHGQQETTLPDWLVKDDSVDELDRFTDIIMTRLRTSDGLDLDFVAQMYGTDKVERILKGAQLGIDLELAQLLNSEEKSNYGLLRLKDPEGFLFSNSIISSIFVEIGVEC